MKLMKKTFHIMATLLTRLRGLSLLQSITGFHFIFYMGGDMTHVSMRHK